MIRGTAGAAGPAAAARLALAAVFALAAAVAAAQQAPAGASGDQACVGGEMPGASEAGTPAFMRSDVKALGDEITCYCGCPHLQVSKCFCGTADKIRADFAARLDGGESHEVIVAAYVQEHGASILAVPPRRGFHWIIWVGPPLLLVLGAAFAWLMGRRWSGRPLPPDLVPAPMDPEAEARYREAVRRVVEEP